MKIATAHEMREIDKATIEWFGLPGVALMENAGRAVAEKAVDILGEPAEKSSLLCAVAAIMAETVVWRPVGCITAVCG